MKAMAERDPLKVAVDKTLDRLLSKLIKSKDFYVDFQWVGDHYEITTKSGKKYLVYKDRLTEE